MGETAAARVREIEWEGDHEHYISKIHFLVQVWAEYASRLAIDKSFKLLVLVLDLHDVAPSLAAGAGYTELDRRLCGREGHDANGAYAPLPNKTGKTVREVDQELTSLRSSAASALSSHIRPVLRRSFGSASEQLRGASHSPSCTVALSSRTTKSPQAGASANCATPRRLRSRARLTCDACRTSSRASIFLSCKTHRTGRTQRLTLPLLCRCPRQHILAISLKRRVASERAKASRLEGKSRAFKANGLFSFQSPLLCNST